MKVISKNAQQAVEFGDKVLLLADSNCGDLSKGDIGVVIAEEDSDGDVKVHNGSAWDYVDHVDLEVLQKFSGKEVTPAGKSVVIELRAHEVSFIADVLDIHSVGSLRKQFNELNTEVA